MNTLSMKHNIENEGEDEKKDVKIPKTEIGHKEVDTSDEYGGGPNPLFKANFKKLGPAKRWKKNIASNQRFIVTMDQLLEPKQEEDLGVGMTHATAVGIDDVVEENKIPEDYLMTLQIGSRDHGKIGETWRAIPIRELTERSIRTQTLLDHVSRVLNSREFISSNVGFSDSLLFVKPDEKGGERKCRSPGQQIWEKVVKEKRCRGELKNKDELCCARAIVTMREYAFNKTKQYRIRKKTQLQATAKLHRDADVPEGPSGQEEIDKFQDFLGPQGFKIVVVSACDGGIIYTGEKFKYATHMIALVKSVYEENGETKAHYDGLTSVPAFINKSYFSQYCWKGYGQEHPRKHNCKSQNCPACLGRRMKGETGCGDFTGWAKPEVYCAECNFWF